MNCSKCFQDAVSSGKVSLSFRGLLYDCSVDKSSRFDKSVCLCRELDLETEVAYRLRRSL